MLLTSSVIGAETITWILSTPGTYGWDCGSCWSTNRVPAPEDDVVIDLEGTYTITVGDKDDLTIDSLTLGPSVLTNTIVLNAGMFTIKSD